MPVVGPKKQYACFLLFEDDVRDGWPPVRESDRS